MTAAHTGEFLHVDDLAVAAVMLMERYNYKDYGELIIYRVRAGAEHQAACGTDRRCGRVPANPGIQQANGTPRKLLDSSRLFALGWKPTIELREGLDAHTASF